MVEQREGRPYLRTLGARSSHSCQSLVCFFWWDINDIFELFASFLLAFPSRHVLVTEGLERRPCSSYPLFPSESTL